MTAPQASATPLLEMRRISKTFNGLRALQDVQLSVHAGEVHALMGENGAGKSTLMKVLAGAHLADPGGEIRVCGAAVAIDGPLGARRHGIAIIYQELSLAPNLTAAENIYLGREPTGFAGTVDRAAMHADCAYVLRRLGAPFGPGALVAGLTLAERQLVEIARAIHARSRILVMDEPTTMLSSRETDRLFELIRQLKAEGLAIVYISHRMAEVYALADRVSVLRDGRFVGELGPGDVRPETIVRMMVGRDLSQFYRKAHAAGARGPAVLEADDFSDGRRVQGASLRLHAGEVVGLAGLVGAGRTELARLIYGAEPARSGRLRLHGRSVALRSPRAAIAAGVVYLTEDRKVEGLLLDLPLLDNVNLAVAGRDAWGGWWLDRRRGVARARESIRSLGIPVRGPEVLVGSLSGGNQQKVLLARLLQAGPRVLLLDEPTRGVDIGAKSEIYRLIDELARGGAAVLVISSDLPEVVGICDRVMVMREGRIAGEVSGPQITEEHIMALATGVSLQAAVA